MKSKVNRVCPNTNVSLTCSQLLYCSIAYYIIVLLYYSNSIVLSCYNIVHREQNQHQPNAGKIWKWLVDYLQSLDKKNNSSWQFSNNAYTSIKKRKAIQLASWLCILNLQFMDALQLPSFQHQCEGKHMDECYWQILNKMCYGKL